MNELFSGNQKMDINNLSIIEEKVILIKESFEKIKTERDKLLAEVKYSFKKPASLSSIS